MPRSASILVVDNHAPVLAIMSEVLRRAGYEVTAAASGAEAVDAAKAAGWAVDLLVTDVKMPVTTGPELAEELLQRAPDLRVLYVSAGNFDRSLAEQVSRGAAHCLPKPFTPTELMAKVEGLLG